MNGRGGVLNLFFYGGLAFLILGGVSFTQFGTGGKIASLTFFLIGGIWVLVSLALGRVFQGMARGRANEQTLFQTGTRATAVFEAVQTTGTVLNNINIRTIMTLRVTPSFGPEFTVTRKMWIPMMSMPQVGDLIDVAYDPNDQTKVALAFNPNAQTGGGVQLITRRPTAPAPAPASPTTFAGSATFAGPMGQPSPAAHPDLDALERLQKLRTDGVLSDDEFETEKRKIIYGQ